MLRLKKVELTGFKSFARKTSLDFGASITSIVGPNGSGKSNVAEALRFVLGEQSMKSMRGKRGEDLIFNGSKVVGRLNRATVAITFDNSDHVFDIDYDEVVLSREVYRDGTNEYMINGTAVRLKDIVELLSVAHIGSSAHHIISQGETDRFLFASIHERRIMVEDALGLRIYQYKISESERKLKKTEENLREITLLRKELAPRITFLKRQVERIERVRKMRDDLSSIYREYLKREELYLEHSRKTLKEEIAGPEKELRELDEKISEARSHIEASGKDNMNSGEVLKLESDIRSARNRKDEASRRLGRIEGMIEFEMKRREKEKERKDTEIENEAPIPLARVREAVHTIEEISDSALEDGDIERVKDALGRVRVLLRDLIEEAVKMRELHTEKVAENLGDVEQMRIDKEEIERQMDSLREEESHVQEMYAAMKMSVEKEKDETRDIERELFTMMSQRNEAALKVNSVRSKMFDLEREEQEFKNEIIEAGVLIGREVLSYMDLPISMEDTIAEGRDVQKAKKKTIERMKIRIEEVGVGGGEDVVKEYDEVMERDAFLSREIDDLVKSAESLRTLIADLSEKLSTEFTDGLAKINRQFQEFFSLLFGGGTASLCVVLPPKKKKSESDDILSAEGGEVPASEEEQEEGLEMNISLPQKRLRGIQALSGGERTLTSLALLFAVSQVNPPPFLVLDETDAALDESNSQKYGTMLETLSKSSQLVIITHNRETMSHAGIIYGVTVGLDAVSKILSIKFEDAEGMMAR